MNKLYHNLSIDSSESFKLYNTGTVSTGFLFNLYTLIIATLRSVVWLRENSPGVLGSFQGVVICECERMNNQDSGRNARAFGTDAESDRPPLKSAAFGEGGIICLVGLRGWMRSSGAAA
jgi:hypothetical protein